MKININQIPTGGLTLEEDESASALDLETETIKFPQALRIKARLFKITNIVSADVILSTALRTICSRCLNEIEIDFQKSLKLNYQVSKSEQVVDLNPEIREEIIVDYPLKPLCSQNCKGLCPKCGKNLNEGDCYCAST
ncbi:MAG: hypothetical protein A2984_00970 [Omnitrophica WOR_2 bacterium RIFCSPLOWO2_01_FULL_41_12]|nr:MAG: hypothetical protein A2984_00970 [Omnitrophica WOR_2 bacterium RIFCSPLOWO2_01_FULL_41_12]